jgi:hypothetical protein
MICTQADRSLSSRLHDILHARKRDDPAAVPPAEPRLLAPINQAARDGPDGGVDTLSAFSWSEPVMERELFE